MCELYMHVFANPVTYNVASQLPIVSYKVYSAHKCTTSQLYEYDRTEVDYNYAWFYSFALLKDTLVYVISYVLCKSLTVLIVHFTTLLVYSYLATAVCSYSQIQEIDCYNQSNTYMLNSCGFTNPNMFTGLLCNAHKILELNITKL